jgi:hypothetical protein
MRPTPRLLLAAIAIAALPLLTACAAPHPTVSSSPEAAESASDLDFSDGSCPSSIDWFVGGLKVDALKTKELDPESFHGPATHPEILDGLKASCVLEIVGPLDYVYYVGGDEKLVTNLVDRFEADGYTAVGANTSAGGYWLDADQNVVAVVYSPDGAETHVPGGEESPPFPSVVSGKPWVALAFL